MNDIHPASLLELDSVIALDLERFGDEAYSARLFKEAIGDKAHRIFVCCSPQKKVIGFIILSFCLDEADIDHVCVSQLEEGKGIGTSLVNFACTYLKEQGYKNLLLEVRKSNLKAICLYEKAGFASYRIREEYYDDNGEDAICYKKGL